MCTTIFYKTEDDRHFFGRTLDFPQLPIGGLVSIPAGTRLYALDGHAVDTQCAYMGMGCAEAKTIMADGVNEYGLSGSTQYIRDGAEYQERDGSGTYENVSGIELLSYMLGRCESVKDVEEQLKRVRVVVQADPVFGEIAPVHHMFADKSGACIVVEYTRDGPDIMENPVGVMTNNPEFRWHLNNLKMQSDTVMYSLHDPDDTRNMAVRTKSVTAHPLPQPGDFSSPSRFIRGTSLTGMINGKFSGEEAVITGIHVLEALSVPRGVYYLMGKEQYTRYLALLSLEEPGYYFKTYHDAALKQVRLRDVPAKAPKLLYQIGQTVRVEQLLKHKL